MHRTSTLLIFLPFLIVTGCSAIKPYPPVSRVQLEERTPGNESLLALIETQPAPAAGLQPAHRNNHSFWVQLRRDFQLAGEQHAAINKQAATYVKNAHYVAQTLRRGEPYLAYIRNEVKKRGLPAEVVLLPFVESGYDPFAYSYGRAAGLWQFIPSTGEYFGLKQDWWYDERRDVVASTDAALDYLDKLQKGFNGDWLLTFAAYNAGGGTVRNAIKRNRKAGKPTDFWNLELPEETKNYVPKLLGICHVIDNAAEYGIALPAIDSVPGFAVIETGDQLDIVVAAGLAEMETDAFYQINPGFNRWATHPDGPHQLAIPVDKAHTFAVNLAKLPASERVKWLRHKTRRGETLSHIAKRYKTTVKVLQQSNGLQSSKIREGSHLLIPLATTNASAYAVLNKRVRKAKIPNNRISHRVESGDNLWSIAKQHQVTVTQLKKWNKLHNSGVIRPGQKLVLWKNSKKTLNGQQLRTIYYAVRSGDSLYSISKKYHVAIADLRRWNKLARNSYLQPGQKLQIHVDVTRLSMK